MHLVFLGALDNALLNGSMPNKRAHAALVNVYLKQAMDTYLGNNTGNDSLVVSPGIGTLLREARGIDPEAYTEWVATVAAELVLDPAGYSRNGYTVPWESVSQPFLVRVWQKDDDIAHSPF